MGSDRQYWVEGDLNMASGESLVRQLLYWEDIRKGVRSQIEVCWEPDTFGHCASYPRSSKSGVKCYYFCRIGGGDTLFWWGGDRWLQSPCHQ